MSLATYKDLCIDAVEPHLLGRFWADTLGLSYQGLDDGDAKLTGPTPQHSVWVNQVPEPVVTKQRVHLDVHAGSVEEVEKRGGTVLDGESFAWTVMRDPEGGELCVFEREEPPAYRLYAVVFDTGEDPRPIAAWWADILGGHESDKDGYAAVENVPSLPFDGLVFVPVPEQKTVKNRIHLDLYVEDLDLLVDAGAGVLRPRDDEIGWTVMTDPEGNEFCAFVR